jgi:hypothetical protein
MNKLILLGIFVSASAHAAGKVVDETRQVGDFTGVHVGSGIQAKVETGARGPIVLHGDEDVLKRVRTEIKDAVLTIVIDHSTHDTSTETPTTVTIRLPRASSLGVSGGAKMDAAVPAAENFEIDASGGGRLQLTTAIQPKRFELNSSGGSSTTLAGVETPQAQLHVSGASRVTIAGRVDTAHVELSGAATLDAAGLQVGDLEIDGSGRAHAEVRAQKSVRGSLSGGSRIRVPAAADVRVDTSGGSSVTRDL